MPNWNENKPAGTDIPNAGLASVLTTNKQAFREGIEKNLFWTDSSGLSAGQPRFSQTSTGPGAARAFYDVVSNASSQVSAQKALDGRLYIGSDTKRFFGYLSGLTVPLGSVDATVWTTTTTLVASSASTIQSDVRTLVQTGTDTATAAAGGGSRLTVTYATAYAVAPFVQAVSLSTSTTNFNNCAVVASGTTNFAIVLTSIFGGSSTMTILWRSHGTVSL